MNSVFATEKDRKNHEKNLKRTAVAIQRKHRLNIVNEIIKDISSRGRRFFYNEGRTAELLLEFGRFYYKAEWGQTEKICLSVPDYRKPKGWFHGGTLFSLVKEFREYVKDGHAREFSVLNSPHWGYPEKDMEAIRCKAVLLGYLQKQSI